MITCFFLNIYDHKICESLHLIRYSIAYFKTKFAPQAFITIICLLFCLLLQERDALSQDFS